MRTTLASLRERPYPNLWAIFDWITTIPRPSGEEAAFRTHLINRAVSHGWSVRRDAAGNVVLAVDGRGDLANEPPLILQGHLDMVCEKNAGVEHNFETDAIPAYVEDDWVRAEGTTLGADNGIAVALALAVAEADMEHRVPLELLFTIEEETGLIGAANLDPDILTGRRLINLDSEDDGIVTIGCAGGVDLTASFDRPAPAPGCSDAIEVALTGLKGGHSGVDIHLGRGNAIAAIARLALRLRNRFPELTVVSLDGGSKRNAIPREAVMVLSGCPEDAVRRDADRLLCELRKSDPDASAAVRFLGEAAGEVPFGAVAFINGCPLGVLRWDPALADLVRTSNSIGVVESETDVCTIVAAGRSSSEQELDDLCGAFARYVRDAGGRFSSGNRYPGWQPKPDAAIVGDVRCAWEQALGETPAIAAIHAGLEAGIIGERIGSDQVVSIGPTIQNPHSPDEQLHIPSTERVYRFLLHMVSSQ